MGLIYVLYKHWSECSCPYGIFWIETSRSTRIICIRLISPRPMFKSLDTVLSLTDTITLYLNQDSNVEKRKVSQCSSRMVAEPMVHFSVFKTSPPPVKSASLYL